MSRPHTFRVSEHERSKCPHCQRQIANPIQRTGVYEIWECPYCVKRWSANRQPKSDFHLRQKTGYKLKAYWIRLLKDGEA